MGSLGRLTKLVPRTGDGGPGTTYSSAGFAEAVKAHGRPFGPFEAKRILPYDGALMLESESVSPLEMPVGRSWERFTDSQLLEIYAPPQTERREQKKWTEQEPADRFRIIEDCPSTTVCLVCYQADGKVRRIKDRHHPGTQSETLHLACAPRFFGD